MQNVCSELRLKAIEDANLNVKDSDIKIEEAERKFERSRNIKKENP